MKSPKRPLKKPPLQRLKFCAVVIGTIAICLAPAARAAVVFAPAIQYRTQKLTDNSGGISNVDGRTMVLDLRLAYQLDPNGILLGGMYKYESDSFINGDLRGYAIGPMIGIVRGAFSLVGTYHFMGERKYALAGVERKFSQGHGPQIDVGWAPIVATNFGLGFQLSWQSIRFDRSQIGTAAETGNSLDESSVNPALLMWFTF